MSTFELVLSADAVNDIDQAVDYYNGLSDGLGFEFTDTINRYFAKIQQLPSASAIRYNQVRVKPVDTFPFTIHYTVTEAQIIILRVFNIYQKPVK
ncbi:type II toxin-antitoxin system RelE/ParE family toxin [Flavihumibacter stibioxidans]|uniref:Type II toxin-antitoxin system RelE/ParE family toxin n=1 Tax=Flavihumibacter stibioxidans TaxID=1834163 RepID=A0ABR7MBF2_9BACT|nr:type II toxin-antitoxin system RelE/ParE family toxin [Flavihumibacter stibioxidans]MBC6492287.1 hypothetical protein [Flavihumibacter stibioxidans]